MTKNQQKFMARKALSIFAYSWLFLAIFSLFANSFINFYLFANIHKSAVLFAPFFLLFLAYFCLFFSVRPVELYISLPLLTLDLIRQLFHFLSILAHPIQFMKNTLRTQNSTHPKYHFSNK